jgi:hypothetical protein
MSKSLSTLISLVLIIGGVGLLYWGYDLSQSFGGQLNKAFNGSETNDAMMAYIGGGAALLLGLYLQFKK